MEEGGGWEGEMSFPTLGGDFHHLIFGPNINLNYICIYIPSTLLDGRSSEFRFLFVGHFQCGSSSTL